VRSPGFAYYENLLLSISRFTGDTCPDVREARSEGHKFFSINVNLKNGSAGQKDRQADRPAAERHELAIIKIKRFLKLHQDTT
jgi:hypothetical protein